MLLSVAKFYSVRAEEVAVVRQGSCHELTFQSGETVQSIGDVSETMSTTESARQRPKRNPDG